ncbi:MAG: Fe2+-enterobactin ABC transporter substrate-binding protein [Citrobacter freundii]|nr:Fe2+-enterobactin ABC transporter substrate-binding protein [Citrobacter freundii]
MSLPSFCRTVLLLAGLSLSGISSGHAADWPRQVTDSRGTHTLEHKPQRIVSTSVTLTGSLLAIDAPVIASGATTPNNRIGDAQGFLRQWSEVAKERKLSRLYIGEPSAIINYDDKSWQSLLTQLGEITGQEQQAAARIAEFDKQLQAVKQRITLPPQPVSALVYTAAAHSANLWTPESAQGKLMEQLGFTLATLPANLHTSQSQGKRHDIIQLGGENLAAGLNGEALFLFAGDSKDADAIYANPLLAHLPAVQNKRVYALGTETFRLDYYSAMLLLQRLSALF